MKSVDLAIHTDPQKPSHGRVITRLMVTRRLLPEVEERIAKEYNSWGAREAQWTEEEIVAAAEGADALLVCLTEKISASVIARLPATVKVIATASIGVDHIDLEAARHRGIRVVNAPGSGIVSTAELAMLLILAASRRAYEGDRLVRSGTWRGWHPTDLLGYELAGKRLGIFGMGRIGSQLARRARAFEMEIHYCNRRRLSPDKEGGAVFHQKVEDLFAASDVLSLNAPSTSETRHVVNARNIDLLPPNAVVVNAARGDLAKDADLIAALKTGRIAAAGLDVFDGEPRVDPGYRELSNVFLLPHLGTATVEARTGMVFQVLDGLNAALADLTSGCVQ